MTPSAGGSSGSNFTSVFYHGSVDDNEPDLDVAAAEYLRVASDVLEEHHTIDRDAEYARLAQENGYYAVLASERLKRGYVPRPVVTYTPTRPSGSRRTDASPRVRCALSVE